MREFRPATVRAEMESAPIMFGARLAGGRIDGHAAHRIADDCFAGRCGSVFCAARTAGPMRVMVVLVIIVPLIIVPGMIVVRHGKASKKHWNFGVGPQIGVPATGRSRGKKHGRRRRKKPTGAGFSPGR
jgi:hypothetical protein